MANFTITWDNNNNGSLLSQDVQYKKTSDVSWTTYANVNAATQLYTINGLSDNEAFDFRVVANCSSGGSGFSPVFTLAKLTCAVVTVTPLSGQLNVSFPILGGDINKYTIELWNSTGTILIQSINKIPPFSSTETGSFSGLSNATPYKIKVIPKIDPGFEGVCSFINSTTL